VPDAPIYYDDTLRSIICHDCGNTDFIENYKRAEKVCKCGLVIDGPELIFFILK
jgi:hypothetical protein